MQHKEKALAEAAALLVLKESPGTLGGQRGRLIPPGQRQLAITLIQQAAIAVGARQHKACEVLDISARTCRRWQGQQRRLDTLADQPPRGSQSTGELPHRS